MILQPTEVLAEYYGMCGAELVPTELGAINDNFFVTHGSNEYVLKRYRSGYSPDHVRWVFQTQSALSSGGIPVPELVTNRLAEVVTQAAGNCYVLSARVPGRHYRRGELPGAAATAMGRVLGRMHALLATVTPVSQHIPPAPAQSIAEYRSLLALAEAGTDPVDAVACQSLRYRIGAMERQARLYPDVAGLPSQWVHGDYQETNILFDEADNVAAVLDFDNLRCRPRGTELMRAIDLCFERRSDGLSPEALAFFRGYAEITRPSPAETALLGPQGAYRAITGTWPFAARYLEPEAYQRRWDRFIVPPSDWWERNMGAVSAQLLAELERLPAGTGPMEPNPRISMNAL